MRENSARTIFMMKTTKSVTTVTAPTRARFRAINQKAFLDDRQKDVLKIATLKRKPAGCQAPRGERASSGGRGREGKRPGFPTTTVYMAVVYVRWFSEKSCSFFRMSFYPSLHQDPPPPTPTWDALFLSKMRFRDLGLSL